MDSAGYHAERAERRAILAEQRAFLESFERQVAEIEARDKLQRKEGRNNVRTLHQ